jgi:hypothetical protein
MRPKQYFSSLTRWHRFHSSVMTLTLAAALAGCGSSGSDAGPGQGGKGGSGPAGTGGAGASGGAGGAGGAQSPGGQGGSSGSGGSSTGGTPGGGGSGGSAGTGDARPGPGSDATGDSAVPNGPAKVVLVAGGLSTPFGVAVDPMTGDIYTADYGDNRIRRIGGTGMPTVVVGPGAAGPAGQVTMNRPHDLLFQPGTRNLFIADTMGSKVLRMNVATGEIAVLAGDGGKVPAGGNAYCLAFDIAGETLYFTGGGGIRVVDLKTDTLKGTLPFANPRVITVDSKGTLYAVRGGGNALQIVTAEGISNAPGGSPVNAPKRIATDREDNVIIVDTESHSISKYLVATRSIVRLIGNGRAGTGTLDGPPEMAQTDRPHGAFVDASGRVLIADSFNDRIIAIVRAP